MKDRRASDDELTEPEIGTVWVTFERATVAVRYSTGGVAAKAARAEGTHGADDEHAREHERDPGSERVHAV